MGEVVSKTLSNLIVAFNRETFVSEKYKVFSEIAIREGYIEIAEILTQISREEAAHAKRFYNLIIEQYNIRIDEKQTEIVASNFTVENLKSALLGENEVWRNMYPKFAKEALTEGLDYIAVVFELFGRAEKIHEDIFIKIYNDLRNDRYFKKEEVVQWICINCGIIVEGKEPPNKCPGCLYNKGYFKVFNDNLVNKSMYKEKNR